MSEERVFDFKLIPKELAEWLIDEKRGEILRKVKATNGEVSMISLYDEKTGELFVCGEKWK